MKVKKKYILSYTIATIRCFLGTLLNASKCNTVEMKTLLHGAKCITVEMKMRLNSAKCNVVLMILLMHLALLSAPTCIEVWWGLGFGMDTRPM